MSQTRWKLARHPVDHRRVITGGTVVLVVAILLSTGCGSSTASGRHVTAETHLAAAVQPTSASLSPGGTLVRPRPTHAKTRAVRPGPTKDAVPRSSTAPVPAPPAQIAEPAAAVALEAGNPGGGAAVPPDARAIDTSHPDRVIGTGTPASCTSRGVTAAVAAGGVIRFACGPRPVTITMTATAKVRNAAAPRVVLDGGGLVTLSGAGQRRILYMDTCDPAQGYTTSHCQDQDSPQLTIQNLTVADGNSTGATFDGGGGGAVFARGGRLKIVHTRFTGNRCDPSGPDLGGAAVRALSQSAGLPVYVVDSTFIGGVCANGGALSSIGVSWAIENSTFIGNRAIGAGANPARGGTPGGGSGGALYTDGNRYTVTIAGTVATDNHANEGGGAIFYVSNDRTGTLTIDGSTLRHNPNDRFATAGLPGIFFLGARSPTVTHSVLS